MGAVAESRLRLFVGLELPRSTRIELARLVDPFRRTAGIRWVRSEDYHLTLRFIGATVTDAIPTLMDALTAVAAGSRGGHMEVGAFGSFPAGERPARVLVALVADDAGWLPALASALAGSMPGTAADRFTPHVTLGRCVPPRCVPQGWTSVHPGTERPRVAEIALFASRSGTGGPRYEVLGSVPLEG